MTTQTIVLARFREDSRRAIRFIEALPLDKAWRIEVSAYRPRRSDQQNRYLWGVVYPAIMKHLEGWHANDVHDYFLGECFGWEEIDGMGRRRLRPVRRSSKLTTTEFMDYVAFIQQRAAEHGIFVPDPELPT